MAGFIKKTLAELFESLPVEILSSSELPGIPVTGVTENSREIKPGYVFVAVKGENFDGHRFISQALAQGAAAVVGTDAINDLPAPYIQVADARRALAYLSASFYNFPAHSMTMIGVTGTDGKTTTSNLIYQILLSAGVPVGIVSTVNAMIGSEMIDTGLHVTTPHAPDVQHYLARMKSAGLTHVILEATSHGLSQHRVTGCEFDIGVLTNITHEHLNDHGSFEAYRDAKASLFTGLSDTPAKQHGREPLAVLNKDDPSFNYLNQLVSVPKVCYALEKGADVWAENTYYDAGGLHFTAMGPGFTQAIDSHLVGDYNVSNCLAAICATVVGLGIDPALARKGIANLSIVPGRMEQINMGQPFMAVVDFAHTPNAMLQILKTARQIAEGRVIVVFGSAGRRDREKRRMMAEIAAQLADVSVLTAEDPRTEPLDQILEEMAAGARAQGGVEDQSFFRVPDRGEALRKAICIASKGDMVIACGKGHEQSMCFGDQEYPWDDRVAMRAALAELMSATGPQMPYLPTQG